MAHAIKVKNVETAYSQASNSHFLDVEVEVRDGETLVGTRRFGFALDASKEQILEELEKVAKTLDSDAEVAAKSAELEAQLANAESLKASLMQ